MGVLKMRSAVASHWKLTTTNWEDHQSWSSYNYMRSCQRTQRWPLPSFRIWSTLERWQSSISECLMSWLKKKKKIVLKCCHLLFYATTNHFTIALWYAVKSGFYVTASNDQLSGHWISEMTLHNTFQSQTCTKKRSWSLFGGLLLVWSTTAFWIPAKPLHLRSMLSKSMRCTENCNACSWHWSTEWAQFFMTTPNCTSHNQRFQIWMNWAMKFCLTHHIHLTSHQPTTTFKHLNNFLQRKCFHNQQEEENAS